MKKAIWLILVLCMAVVLTGCAGQDKPAAQETAKPAEQAAAQVEITSGPETAQESEVTEVPAQQEEKAGIVFDQEILRKGGSLPIGETGAGLNAEDFSVYQMKGPENESEKIIHILILENRSEQPVMFTVASAGEGGYSRRKDVMPGETILVSEHLFTSQVPEAFRIRVDRYSADQYAEENPGYTGAKEHFEEQRVIRKAQSEYKVADYSVEIRDDGRQILHLKLTDAEGKQVTSQDELITRDVQPAILCFDENGQYVEFGSIGFGTITTVDEGDLSLIVPAKVKAFSFVIYAGSWKSN